MYSSGKNSNADDVEIIGAVDGESRPFTDTEIVAAINDVDDLAFETLMEHCRPILVKNAKRYRCLSEDEGEDIVQHLFNRLWENHDTWKTDNVSKYLHGAVKNRIIDLHRSQKRLVPISEELSRSPAFTNLSDSVDRPALEGEFQKAFDEAVESLSARDKTVCVSLDGRQRRIDPGRQRSAWVRALSGAYGVQWNAPFSGKRAH